MTLRSLLAAAACTIAAGCSTSTTPIDGPIDYEVIGGFTGQGDGTPALHIELDGSLLRTPPGQAGVPSKLDAATLQSLLDKLERAELPSPPAVYKCCDDDFVRVVTVGVDGELHGARADRGADVPQALEDALDALHAIAIAN
jgi:hypothetical protein